MACVAALDNTPPAGPTEQEIQRAEAQVETLRLAVQRQASGENLQALAEAQRARKELVRRYVGERIGAW